MEGRTREQVPPRMPSAPDRNHIAAGDPEPTVEQQALAPHHVPVVALQGRSPAEALEQIVRLVWLGADGKVWCGPCQDHRVRFEEVAARIEGIPFMSPALGRRAHDHIIAARPEQAPELGTPHGVSAPYIAAPPE